jgi:hypothetical protein
MSSPAQQRAKGITSTTQIPPLTPGAAERGADGAARLPYLILGHRREAPYLDLSGQSR